MEIGIWLLRALLPEGDVFGLQVARRDTTQVTYQVYKEATSALVIEAFRKQAAGRAVYGVKQPRAWTRLPYDATLPA